MTKPYIIDIVGDNILSTGEIFLTDAEIAVFRKIISAMTSDGRYVPSIFICDFYAEKQMEAERVKKENEERLRREEEESLRYPTSMALAFQKAMAKKS